MLITARAGRARSCGPRGPPARRPRLRAVHGRPPGLDPRVPGRARAVRPRAGAFTGADAAGPGLLNRVGRGTLFFDEIAEAPLSIQAKLLRVLDGGEYRPVGAAADRTLKARVVAATNRDLETWSRSGAFRTDLYYRLAVLPIHLPPLRERLDDIPTLWDHFLDRIHPGKFAPLDPESALGRRLLGHIGPGTSGS